MIEYYNMKSEDVISSFKSNSKLGLSLNQVQKQSDKYGFNELKQKKKINPIFIFFNQFRSFIIYILIFAVIVSFISQEYVEAIVISIILVFNAVFGFIQEYKAEKAIDALKKISALKARVIRAGKEKYIETKELVPGDIIILEEGSQIPADARIVENYSMQISESALTGESVSVLKSVDVVLGKQVIAARMNMLFSSTAVVSGHGRAIVTSIGMDTEIGKIARLLDSTEDTLTPLQVKLEEFGKWVGIITIVICLIIFITGIIKDGLLSILLSGNLGLFVFEAREWFLVAISLAVAAVPEGLPAIVTIALAIGVKKMLSKKSLIRKLPSVETLGETTVICTDKTGTLTENQMTVRKVWTLDGEADFEGQGYNPYGAVSKVLNPIIYRAGFLCNDSKHFKKRNFWKITGDPTEAALLVSAKKAGFSVESEINAWKRIDEVPFSSTRKIMSTLNQNPNTKNIHVFSKGATENLIKICDRALIAGKLVKLDSKIRKLILDKNEAFASGALRVLGLAYKDVSKNYDKNKEKIESNLIFIGLQAMIDPPRKEVKESIEKCVSAGIRVIMITGDNQVTAKAIANEIGINGGALNGLEFEVLSKSEQKKVLNSVSIFSRVEPIHKMQIVKLLQSQGEIVAMTGDGVNDAPAIKQADLGISMGINGTDVAKESSDMILLDDNFTSIVNAIEEGRGIYQNVKKFINYLFSSNLAEVMIIFLAILFGLSLPMTAIMLLWLNLITDGLPAIALSVDPKSKTIMNEKPKKSSESIMNKVTMFHVGYVSSLITIAVLGLFIWAEGFYSGNLEKMQTIAFTGIIVMEFVRLQAIRSEYNLGIFSNMYLVYAVIASISLQLLVIYTPLNSFFGTVPLNLMDWTMIITVSIVVLILNIIGSKMREKYAWFEE